MIRHATGVAVLLAAMLTAASAAAKYAGPRGGVVGIVTVRHDGAVVVDRVMPGSGAARAGVVEGCTIIAVGGVPVAGLSDEDIDCLLAGGVGSDVELTLRDVFGAERSVSVIREAIIDPSDPGIPIVPNLAKPHDLRPEDGMVCALEEITGRTAVIGCGENAGIDMRQGVRFTRRADYAKHRMLAGGTVTKVGKTTSNVAISGNAGALSTGDVIAVTSAWRSERARENMLWRVTALGIGLLDYPSGLPYATIDQLRFDVDSMLEKAAVTKMAERLNQASDVMHEVFKGRAEKGLFRGKSVAGALRSTTPKDVMAFLGYLVTYPDNFVGRDWYLPEVYATWVVDGTPHVE